MKNNTIKSKEEIEIKEKKPVLTWAVGFKSASAFLVFILAITFIIQQQYLLGIALLFVSLSEFTFVIDRVFPPKKNNVE